MAEKKSILEEALLEAKQIEEALKSNTKEILATTFKQEIGDLVKESLKEDTVEENDLSKTGNVEEQLDLADLEDDEEGEEEMDIEIPADIGGDEIEDLEAPEDEEGMDLEMPELPEPEMLGDPDAGEDELDLTDASDDDVLKIFKDMSDSDEIVVVKTDDGVEISDKETGADYIVKGVGESENNESTEEMDEEEPIYEIVFDESEEITEETEEITEEDKVEEKEEVAEEVVAEEETIEETDEIKEEDKVDEKTEEVTEVDETNEDEDAVEEGSRTLGNGKSHGRNGLNKPRTYSSSVAVDESKKGKSTITKSDEYKVLISEMENLKSKNGEYKAALKVFRNKLNEVAVFNSNLAYATRLFTEHSTSKKEKLSILKRFDLVESLKGSKGLYKSICNELNENKSVTETIDESVNKTVTQGSANLNESTAYVDPQVNAIKSLMDRIGRR